MDKEVKFVIDGKDIVNFNNFSIIRTIDSISDGFSANFLVTDDNKEILSSLKPFKHQSCQIFIDKKLFFTGYVEKVETSFSVGDFSISLSGRSKTGVLFESSCEDFSSYEGLSLSGIAKKILSKFSIDVVAEEDSKVFDEVFATHGETIFSFLYRLARDSRKFFSCDSFGRLVIKSISKKTSSATFVEGEGIIRSILSIFDSTSRFSNFTVASQTYGYENISSSSNDKEISIYKPFFIDGGSALDLSLATSFYKKEALKKSFSISMDVEDWVNKNGDVFTPGDFITLSAPSSFILTPYDFVVSSVSSFFSSDGGFWSRLSLDFFESFVSDDISRLPWD